MKFSGAVLFLFLITFSTTAQEDWIFHRPCFNDDVSAFSASLLDGNVFICTHDLPSEDSLPSPHTRTKLMMVKDSCNLTDAQLYHSEKQSYLTLNVLGNTGPTSTENNGNLMFVSHTSDPVTQGEMGLYVLHKQDGGWVVQQPFPFNSSEYSIMHPTYDEEGQRLYYTSNRDSDHYQLWYTPFDGQSFEDTMIYLDGVNQDQSEDVFPSFANGKLYFTSNRGHLEKLALFESYQGQSGRWYVERMKDSLLFSAYDDFALHMITDRTGFFATNRYTFGKKDQLMAFRRPVDCSQFPTFGDQQIPSSVEEMDNAMAVIQEFKNVYGPESEEVYRLNLGYVEEMMNSRMNDLAVFYCELFNTLDSISLRTMDYSMHQSLKSEALIDSLVHTISNDLQNEKLIDSLLSVVQEQYDEVGVKLEMEEERRELKKILDPVRNMNDSIEKLTDSIKQTLVSRLKGQTMNKRDMPDFAKEKGGLFFAVQLGAFSKKADPGTFSNIQKVMEVIDEGSGLYHYVTGYCNNLDDALMSQAQVRGVGYPDAFIVAYCNGERVPLFKAKQLLESGECQPIKKSVKPAINYSIVKKPPEEDKKEDATAGEIDMDYNKAEGAVTATPSESEEDLFYTVQIGVYEEPATLEDTKNLPDLITTLLPNGNIRYSTGMFETRAAANDALPKAIEAGFTDAYVTAYYQGSRVPLFKAAELERGR